jgi:hypothetical protein
MKSIKNSSHWILSPITDGIFILSPPFIILCVVFSFPVYFSENDYVNPLIWFILVLGIDVSHVYSTIFRTYLEPATFQKHKTKLILVPVIIWFIGMMLYSIGSIIFWRTLAYLAVFHFIRQQYGFLRIYTAKETKPKWFKKMETVIIYMITGIPMLIWHFSADRSFVWFMKSDFFIHSFNPIIPYLQYLLFSVAIIYSVSEMIFILKTKTYNMAKYLLLSGTFITWYFGIVYFNSDLIFTLFNVVSHGVPYIALIWFYGKKKNVIKKTWYSFIFSWKGMIIYITIIFLLAYTEEGLWNSLVWKEHDAFFSLFNKIPQLDSTYWYKIVIPLLSVPQISHYIIDGFIWKIKNDKYDWKEHLIDK